MPFVGIRELLRDTSRVIERFERTGEPVVLTRDGEPIGALVGVDQRELADLVLATAPKFGGRSAEEGEHSAADVARAIGAPRHAP